MNEQTDKVILRADVHNKRRIDKYVENNETLL